MTEAESSGGGENRSRPRRAVGPLVFPVFALALTLRIAVVAVSGTSDMPVRLANSVLGAAAAFLLAQLSLRIFASTPAALATGILAAVAPSLILISTQTGTEALLQTLLLASAFLLLVCADRPSSNFGVLAGALLGLAILLRPAAVVLAPLWLAGLADRRYPWRVRAHLAGSVLLGCALLLAPGWIGFSSTARAFVSSEPAEGISSRLGLSLAAITLALAVLAIRGFMNGVSTRRGVDLFALGVLGLSIVLPLAAFESWRDRGTFWDPVLILYAARGIVRRP